MSSNSPEKKERSLIPPNDQEETSFIKNIQIDLSDADRSFSSGITNSGTAQLSSGSSGNTGLLNVGGLRSTKLALDPRPFRRRERFYQIIISVLTAITLLLAATVILLTQYQRNIPFNEIIISGVETDRHSLEEKASLFMQKSVGASVIVDTKPSRNAFAELIDGRVSIVQTINPLSEDEKNRINSLTGQSLQEIKGKRSAVAFYIHKDNLVNEITSEQLKALLQGKITNWKDLGGKDEDILLFQASPLSDLHLYLTKKLSLSNIATVRQYESTSELFRELSTNPHSIGFGEATLGYQNLKLLQIKDNNQSPAQSPFIDNHLNESYPLTYQIFWYSFNSNNESMKDFINKLKE